MALLGLAWSSFNLLFLSLLCLCFQPPVLLPSGQDAALQSLFFLGTMERERAGDGLLSLAMLQQTACLPFPWSQAKLLSTWCPPRVCGEGSWRCQCCFFSDLYNWVKHLRKSISALRHCSVSGTESKDREWSTSAFTVLGNLTDTCPTSLVWYLRISSDFICYFYQEFRWQYSYLLWRNTVFCYEKVLEISSGI